MAEHTPGPWVTCNNAKCSCFTVMANDHPIAEVTHGAWGDEYPEVRLAQTDDGMRAEAFMRMHEYGSVDDGVARANWRLIAAAPDLLSALQAVAPYFYGEHAHDHPHCVQLRAAIAKATP